jgi:hypothetical protein
MHPWPGRRRLLAALALAAAAPAVFPQSGERRVPVTLSGNAVQRFEDTITEFEIVSYVVPLRAGQSLQISLASSNASNCFDIHAPDAPKPIYIGSESGNTHLLHAKVSGEYQVKVFLLRFAARDGQSSQYTLELKLAD